jgi:hypothetical protein
MKYLKLFALIFAITGLIGCGETNSFVGDGTVDVPVDGTTVSSLVIGTDKVAVQSDSSDSAAITVTALDSNNVLVAGANIAFSTPAGQLDAALVTTGSDGKATVNFSAGAADPTNQTVTITASAGAGVSAAVPVQIVGSTVKFATTTVSQLTVGGVDTLTLTLTSADSSGQPVFGVPVTVAIDSTSTATGQLDPATTAAQTYTATTNTSGQITVDIKGLTAGNLVLSASALGATASKTLTVVTSTGALQIASPADASAVQVNSSQNVTITVPAGMNSVTLATSLGVWGTVNTAPVNQSTYTVSGVAGTTITATISSAETGTATVMVFDSNNVGISHSIKLFFVNSTVDGTTNIALQAASSTVPISVGDTVYSVTITGRVTDAGDNGVANAPVSLSLANQPGGGEYVDPPYVFSDASGVFETTFYSGSIGSDSNGVDIIATLVGNGKTSKVSIIISQTAGSVVIGRSTVMTSINNNTAYSLPMSVQVSDANGSPVPNATVSLKIWPKRYYMGGWDGGEDAVYTGVFNNEDVNRNLIMDPGEERSFVEGHYSYIATGLSFNADFNGDGDGFDVVGGDGILTPPNTAAGGLPATVETDENGLGTFNLVYLKENAAWIEAEITATVQAQGTESTGVLTFVLPVLKSDASSGVLPPSPFNRTSDPSYSVDGLGLGAAGVAAGSADTIVATSGTTTLNVRVGDATLNPISGASVGITFVSEGSNGTVAPALSVPTITTGADGYGTATYTAGDQAGLDVILVQTTIGGVVHTNYIRINVQ